MASKTRLLANLITSTGDVKAINLDNVPASSPGVQVYATKENLPTTGLTSGDQAYVTNTSRLYISNGSGWYNVALINATPSLTIDPLGTIELAKDGSTPTVVTLTATDSDNAVDGLTFSVDSDGSFAGLGTISQDSSVFTITPLSEDSATTTLSTLTFKASDGISFGSGTSTISLTFKVTNSNHTTLLLQADTAGTDNQVDASTNTHTITETGNVTSTGFSPYHPGGYSTYLDGTGDWLNIANASEQLVPESGDFTVELWFYTTNASTRMDPYSSYTASTGFGIILSHTSGGMVSTYKGNTITNASASGQFSANVWNHLAVSRSGTTTKIFINGTAIHTNASDSTDYSGTSTLYIGAAGNASLPYTGYLRDVRFVKGTAVYTSNFTAPTDPLTAITNTKLLTCHLPYIADGSSDAATITKVGNIHTQRFSPYDYLGYTTADHRGSVYFDGSGDHLTVAASSDFDFGTGEFTIEWWQYWDGAHTGYGSVYDNNYATNPNLILQTGNGVAQYNVYMNGTSAAFLESSAAALNVWTHYALVRSGTTVTLYRNGTSTGSMTYAGAVGNSSVIVGIGSGTPANAYGIKGYFSDFRVVKGTAVYTSAFTPPTARLTAISGTSLLTCTNKNDIWDASSGSQIMTKSGNVTASNTQRKFATSSAIYFDGSGDYLDFVKKDEYHFGGSDDFTVEGWWYFAANPSSSIPLILMGTGVDATPAHYSDWIMYRNGSGNFSFGQYSNTGNTFRNFASFAPTLNTWYHIAVSRSGTDLKGFIDGVQQGSTITDSTAWTNKSGSRPLRMGRFISGGGSSSYFNGYAQDVRITKGLARYTSNFTPPTTESKG